MLITDEIFYEKKIKLLFFYQIFKGGGAERVTVELINMMSIRNYDVHLILSHKNGPYLEKLNDKVKLHDLKSKKYHYHFLN